MNRIEHDEESTVSGTPTHQAANRLISGQFLLQVSLILLAGVIAYGNSLNGPFHFDDLGISEKIYLWPRAFNSSPRQLVDLTFVANHLIHGKNVFGYHLVNVTVHLAAAVVLLSLVSSALKALTLTSRHGHIPDETLFINRFIPFAVALLFVCHPVQTQAVTYIVQRYASMAALFYFSSVLAYIHARMAAIQNATKWRTVTFSFLTLLFIAIALRCKETAYTLPLMLIVVETFLFRGRLLRNRVFVACMAFALLAIPLLRIAQHGLGSFEELYFSIKHGTREELTYSRGDYLMTQFRVVASYLRLLVAPVNLNLDYDIPLQKSFFALPVLASLALHLALMAVSATLFIRSGRMMAGSSGLHTGICLRLASFGIVWFYLTLMVESSFIPILDVMFEHRVYLPSAGGFLFLTASVATLASRRPATQTASWAVLAILCCILTVATIQRNRIWNDDLLLWEDTARKSPNKARVLANLTAAYLDAKRPREAAPMILRTLELAPGLTDPLINLGMVLDLLGVYEGRYDNGQRYVVESRKIDMRNHTPWFANTRNNLGLVYEYTGNYAAALRCYEAAVAYSPSFELAWYNLFLVATRQQDHMRASAAYKKLQGLNPELARSAMLRIQPPLR